MGKSVSKKRQQPPTHKEETWTTDDDEEPTRKVVMNLLGSMSSKVGAYEKRLGEMTSKTTAQATFTAHLAPSTSRVLKKGTTQSQPTSAALDGFPDMVKEVRNRVAN